jgi:hypothetical protein
VKASLVLRKSVHNANKVAAKFKLGHKGLNTDSALFARKLPQPANQPIHIGRHEFRAKPAGDVTGGHARAT